MRCSLGRKCLRVGGLLAAATLLLLYSVQLWAAPVAVRILHINDFHGFANQVSVSGASSPLGGAARLAEAIRQQRDVPGVLLAAGDMVQGDAWANLTGGISSIEFLNLLGVDAMTPGNHEFDFGAARLQKLIAAARFPVLAANLHGVAGVRDAALFERASVRIAVAGLITDETPYSSHPRNTVGLRFDPPAAEARRQVQQLQHKADLVVLLTHIGFEEDLALARMLCGSAGSVTVPVLLVGGHSHTRVDRPVQIGACTVVQAWEHGKVLGVVDYRFDEGRFLGLTGRLLPIDSSLGEGDPTVATLVQNYNQKVEAALGRQVGTAAVPLDQTGSRRQETVLGNLVADLVRKETGAQVALINGGSLRTTIPQGVITARQVYAALPFDNYPVAIRMQGRDLLAALEHGVAAGEQESGRFPQVAGLRFSYRPTLPSGRRIVSVEVGGEPLDTGREYTVATLDFMASGGDGYRMFGEVLRSDPLFSDNGGALRSNRLTYHDPGRLLRDLVIDYLATQSVVAPQIEGRIIRLP